MHRSIFKIFRAGTHNVMKGIQAVEQSSIQDNLFHGSLNSKFYR